MKQLHQARAGLTVGIGIAAGFSLADERPILPFTDEAIERGLVYEIRAIQATDDGSAGGLGFGIAIADLTGNGHQDVVALGTPGGMVGFFENDGTGHFTDRSYTLNGQGQPVPKVTLTRPSGISVADYNGDGMLDVYITQQMNPANGATYRNLLLRNNGDFNFTNVAMPAGVDNQGNSEGASWGDFDNDGWLDLYVANFTPQSLAGDPMHRNKLYRNLGDGSFDDVSAEQGVDNTGAGFIAAFSDTNRNGWLDLYLANDKGFYPAFSPNQFWINNRGQYELACETRGACLGLWAMCVAAGDFNGNGYPDFYVTNIAHPAGYNGWNPLLVNNGDGTFTEQCTDAGVCQLITSWAGIFFDYDNNGWLDLYVCNAVQPNNLFANGGEFPVASVTAETGVGGSPGNSYNAAVGDVTGNGAIDILLNDFGSNGVPRNVQLFINHEGAIRNWIRFNVIGYAPNHFAVGANIEITAGEHTQWREIYAGGNNYKSQNELVFHFGLGEAAIVDQIVVNWPGNRNTRTLSNYPANHTWSIYPPEVLGDANGDNVINVVDLLALLGAWGQIAPGNEIMDLNGDGVVNVVDLLGLLGKWGPLN